MITYVCDACGKHLVSEGSVYHVTDENIGVYALFRFGTDEKPLDIHLCSDCKRDLQGWLLSHKKHTEEISDG